MTGEEENERREILRAIDAAEFRFGEFNRWLYGMGFLQEDTERGWWWYATRHGHLTFTLKDLGGVVRVTFCSYIPQSTNEALPIVTGGRSASGKSLSEAELEAIQSDFSFEAIPGRVLWTCAMETRRAPEDVTAETSIVEDLLYGDDDEFEREFLLGRIFDELEFWFEFERPDLFEQSGRFRTVQDIITYVEEHYV
jgi:hypothetical protein